MNQVSSKKNSTIIPLMLVGVMFFVIGFGVGISGFLIPALKSAFSLSTGQSYLVTAAIFSAFVIFGRPTGWIIKKIGYRRSMVLAFLIMALGIIVCVQWLGSRYSVTVHNQTARTLEQVRVHGGGVQELLGSIGPGSRATAVLRLQQEGMLVVELRDESEQREGTVVGYLSREEGGASVVRIPEEGEFQVHHRWRFPP